MTSKLSSGDDLLVGKHGDHVGGERDAVEGARRGEGRRRPASWTRNHLAVHASEGTIPAGGTRVARRRQKPYDHCNFTTLEDAPADLIATFRELLLGMSYDDPEVRPLLDLEGLKVWKPGRVEGYAQLAAAVDRFHTIDAFVEATAKR